MAAFGTRTSARATSTTIAIGATAGPDVAPNVGRFSYFLDDERWEWSDAVARIHGYEPGTITVTTELVLSHKHPDDRSAVADILSGARIGNAGPEKGPKPITHNATGLTRGPDGLRPGTPRTLALPEGTFIRAQVTLRDDGAPRIDEP